MEVLMTKKLTLSIDENIVEFAHSFSLKYNKSISRIIEDYLIFLKEQNATELPNDLEELYGIFEGIDVPEKKELRKMFHDKYSN
jgi:hypothetical protein